MRALEPMIEAVTNRLMELLDARLPGRLKAFYLVGSVALGDFRAGQSDVDFVAELAEPHDMAVLAGIHAELEIEYPGLHCDGIYLRPGDLSAPPAGEGPSARAGRVIHSGDERHPVTWLTLADHGIALRGRAPDRRWIAADPAAAVEYSRANLDTYWRNWLKARRRLVSPGGLMLLMDGVVIWGCLGIPRLHATIKQGIVPSKTGAGEYALAAFPDHARIIAECLRLRTGRATPSRYRSPLSRRRDLIAFMDAVLADA